MKNLWIAAILAALALDAVGAQHEQHGMAHQVAAGVKLEARDDPAAQSITLRLGPVNLPAHADHMAVAQPPDLFWTVPVEGWLVAYHPRLTDAVGKTLLGRLLHHVAFWNTNRADFLCPNKQEHIFGAGGEMNDWPEVPGYGYRVARGDRVRVETMFHNPTDTAYTEIYFEVRVEYRRAGATPAPMRSIYPAWFDVMRCRDSGYDLKPGRSVTAGEITLRYSGLLLGVGGHLHDYGRALALENLTREELIAALSSHLDSEGRILSMPVASFAERGGYRLARGERLRVTATYENRTGKLLPEGAMGIVVGYFLPDDDAQMGLLRRSHK